MHKKVKFSGEELEYDRIARHHEQTQRSLRDYFTSGQDPECVGLAQPEIVKIVDESLSHQESQDIFSLLAFIEAQFKVDYLHRCQTKQKDSFSKELRQELYKRKSGHRASFEDQILKIWQAEKKLPARVLNDIHHAIKFRNWLAHGRYWELHHTFRRFDFFELCQLVEAVLRANVLSRPARQPS